MIIPLPQLDYLKLTAYAAAAVLVFGAGWKVEEWRASDQVAQVKLDALKHERDAVDREVRLQKERDDKQHADELAVAAIDKAELERLKGAEHETEHLRTCIANGTCGLRIAAKCSPRPGNVPASSAGPRVGSAGSAELDPAAGRAYLALRKGIDTVTGQLKACQAIVRTYTGQ